LSASPYRRRADVPADRYSLTVAAPTFWLPLSGTMLESSRATATSFTLAIGESRVVDLLLVR
jgi:hypothetical protein